MLPLSVTKMQSAFGRPS